MHHILLWAHERKELGEAIHLWGSLPCAPWPSWQNMNVHGLDVTRRSDLERKRQECGVIVRNFSDLTDVAIDSGGSSSFEWPRYCSGWVEVQELTDMIVKHSMFSAFPCGCAFDLVVEGRRPLKPWRIVTTNERVAVEMNHRRCRHQKGHERDPLEGGRLAYLSGFYNRAMASSILCSLFPNKFMQGVPCMPVIPYESDEPICHDRLERIAGQLIDGRCFQCAQALVHRLLSRNEIENDPKAIEAIKNEINELRGMHAWDDSSVCELEGLKQWARHEGQEIHIAEIMGIGSIKHDELGPSLSQHKGRLVFSGDNTRNQDGLPAQFRELHSQPASIQTVSMVLFYGLLTDMVVFIADAKKAYLQAPLRTKTPTWVILPRLYWLPGWEKRFRRPAVRRRKALYGHPEAGDDWFHHLSQIMTKELGFRTVESFPSLWWNPVTRVLTAAYVDDVICAGPRTAVWSKLRSRVEVDGVTVPGRYLGRNHVISEITEGKGLFLSVEKYCESAVELYHQALGSNR